MEIQVAASSVGKKRFFIDLTHWERVERRHRPFLINSGWPEGLTEGVLDIKRYVEDVAELYREAVRQSGEASKEAGRLLAKMLPLRLILPLKFEVDKSTLTELRTSWEIKTHIEEVLGRKFHGWGRVYTGRAVLEVRDRAVYVGGVPSLGHTYLRLLGVLNL